MKARLTPFPGVLQHLQRALDPFPVRQVPEGVGDGLRVAPLQDVLGGQDQRLQLQQVERHVRVELDRAVDGLDGRRLRRAESPPTERVRLEPKNAAGETKHSLFRDQPRFQQRRTEANGRRLGQRNI